MRVLLIDDSLTMRHMEASQLCQLGINDIIQAGDGQAGLELLARHMPVDIILLDINMPVMDGMAVLKNIRNNRRYNGIKIIMITSESEKSKVITALRAGANDYLIKPFKPEDFKKRIVL